MAELKRELGLVGATAIGLGAIVGAGIFVILGIASSAAGPATIISLVIAGFGAFCNALSSAELAAKYPQSGGTYEYGYQLLNPASGFSAGWLFLVSKLTAASTVAKGIGAYLALYLPTVNPTIISVGAVLILTVANLLGIKKAGALNVVIVLITLSSLLYFIVSGVPTVSTANFSPFAPGGISGILEAASLLFFAYTGYARLATIGEEVHEPRRTIPKAIIASLSIAIVVYVLIAVVLLGNIPFTTLSGNTSAIQLAAITFGNSTLVTVIGVGACTAMLGVLLSQILGISRMMFAMSRRNDLMPQLSRISKRSSVPSIAILATGTIILLLTLFLDIRELSALASFDILLYYSIANLAALRLPKADKRYHNVIAVLGLIVCVVLAFSLKMSILLLGVGLLVVGFILRYVNHRYYSTIVQS